MINPPSTVEKQSETKKSNARGGKRPGAGRKRGQKNATTLEIEAAAKAHSGDAIAALVAVATKGKREAARVAAAVALLDRAYGRPKQTTDVTSGGQPIGGISWQVVKPEPGTSPRRLDAIVTAGNNGHGQNGNGSG